MEKVETEVEGMKLKEEGGSLSHGFVWLQAGRFLQWLSREEEDDGSLHWLLCEEEKGLGWVKSQSK